MTMKPIMQPHVEIIPLPLECASGMMSSATMKIMAPAANAKPIGKIVVATDTARAPACRRGNEKDYAMSFAFLLIQSNQPFDICHRFDRKEIVSPRTPKIGSTIPLS